MNKNFFIGILAAGKGTRMESNIPKVLHNLENKALIDYVLDTAYELNPEKIFTVVGFKKELVINHINNPNIEYIEQKEQLGTGHAVLQLDNPLYGKNGHLLILYGDVPNIKHSTLSPIVDEHIKENADVTMITAILEDPTGYGRIIRDQSGNLIKIVEEKDCNKSEKAIKEINPGIYIFKISKLFKNLKKVKSNNESKEYYLTDVIELINNSGTVKTKKIDNPKEIMGINTIKQLELLQK
jgi:UDP-N-acetylglucosamine diphosphorylase/glucosamine-1-phosphate N-acetyltransferase|tara:strand:- start:88 stop:807 length:720 start_codon:yes stop_codon:yes gene_type:complete